MGQGLSFLDCCKTRDTKLKKSEEVSKKLHN